MAGQSSPIRDIPVPPIEPGDFVRLKEPYPMTTLGLQSGTFSKTLREVCIARFKSDPSTVTDTEREFLNKRLDSDNPPGAEFFKDLVAYQDLFEWTHGTVAETITRYGSGSVSPEYASRFVEDKRDPPARNVALHLYNPKTGLIYTGGHPTESGKPEFVDFHIKNLVLIHKATDNWGNEYELDLAEAYERLGINTV